MKRSETALPDRKARYAKYIKSEHLGTRSNSNHPHIFIILNNALYHWGTVVLSGAPRPRTGQGTGISA